MRRRLLIIVVTLAVATVSFVALTWLVVADDGEGQRTIERHGLQRLLGVSFYGSATLDPAYGPGVRRNTDGAESGEDAWAGYVNAGEVVVYVADPDRAVVDGVLDSVSAN